MKKACLLDQTLQLPPIGTRVAIHDDAELGLPHPGTVCGHGQTTCAGSTITPTTPLVPTVLIALDGGVYLPLATNESPQRLRQRCFVFVIAVHPDNLLVDEYGEYVEAL